MSLTCLFRAAVFAACLAGTGADPRPVITTVGQMALLPTGMAIGPHITEVVWKRLPNIRIAEYSKNNIEYFGTMEYKKRVTFKVRNYELEIRDLRIEDTADYEVIFVTNSGSETPTIVRLEVYEPISGTQVKAKNITSICNFFLLTCSVTLGNPTRFNWWKNSEPLGNDSIHYFQENRDTVEIHHSGAVAGIVYKCEASNPISKNKAEILLKDICEHTATGLPWWVIMLIAIGVLIAIIGVLFITYRCVLSARHVTWTELHAGWVDWRQEDPKSRASFCTFLWNPKSVI